MKTYTLHVEGTHCASCKLFIEDALRGEPGIHRVDVDLAKKTVEFDSDSEQGAEAFAAQLTKKIQSQGYTLLVNKAPLRTTTHDDIWKALPIGLAVLFGFFFLQKSGILNFGIGGTVTPTTGFVIGLIASVSSCLAIVGGLVLSLSAKMSQDAVSDTKTFALFHVGRIVSFALLGGVLGLVGSALGINFTVTALLGIVAALVMLALGFNLLGIFKNKLTLNSKVFGFFRKIEHKTLTPLLVGFGTFFLPCGFTQSMQVVALSSGSFISGAGIMLAFALGTFPVLALLSFGSTSFSRSRHAPIFFKSAGVVVIGLGLFALLGGLASLGIINPILAL